MANLIPDDKKCKRCDGKGYHDEALVDYSGRSMTLTGKNIHTVTCINCDNGQINPAIYYKSIGGPAWDRYQIEHPECRE